MDVYQEQSIVPQYTIENEPALSWNFSKMIKLPIEFPHHSMSVFK